MSGAANRAIANLETKLHALGKHVFFCSDATMSATA